MAATPAANAQVGIRRDAGAGRIEGRAMCRAPSAGQTATHSRHPGHSADLMGMSLSTGRAEGQAFAHFAQSMHASLLRRMRIRLKIEVRPTNAPYGHR